MLRKFFLLTGILLGLPLLGVVLAGLPLDRYLEFPPQTRYVHHAPFSWAVFGGYGLFIFAAVSPLVLRALRAENRPAAIAAPRYPFPWWGWPGLFSGLIFWILAWTRFHWFARLQPHTFTPLWLSFILVMNALLFKRKGSCLLSERRGFFLSLFPASAVFWWFFEYLNRFVQNWHYVGVRYDPGEYFLYATLSFSTVLPAVMSVREWLLTFTWLQNGFKKYAVFNFCGNRRIAGYLLLLPAAAGLMLTGVRPDYFFSLLWLAPLIVLVSLQVLSGESHVLAGAATGDWRLIIASALAALVCGWFWEMWNFYSLAKWQYSIPYVERFRIFEMPVLGYAGYLPFGLQCTAVCELIASLPGLKPKSLEA
ncbi:MAG: hypothetical protein AB1427_10415 [Thermodesulfobacteriota bacterium]